MAPLKVSILGTGLSLQVFHLPLIQALPDQFILHSVLERSGKETCRTIVGDKVKIVTTFEEVISDKEVDVVVVCTPNKTHAEFVKRGLEAGKHVICEKPLVPTPEEAEQLFALAKKQGKILAVYQNRRWDADFLTLKSILDSGKIGPLVEFSSHFDRYRPTASPSAWKGHPGEFHDTIYDLGSHLIDQVVALYGKPKRVNCRNWSMRGVDGVNDSFVLDLEYPPMNGSKSPLFATCRCSILSAVDPQLRYLAKGTLGSFSKTNLDTQEPFLKAGGKVRGEGWGVDDEKDWGVVTVPTKEGGFAKEVVKSIPGDYVKIYENFHLAMSSSDESKLIVKPEEAVLVLKIIQAGFASSKEGRWVEI